VALARHNSERKPARGERLTRYGVRSTDSAMSLAGQFSGRFEFHTEIRPAATKAGRGGGRHNYFFSVYWYQCQPLTGPPIPPSPLYFPFLPVFLSPSCNLRQGKERRKIKGLILHRTPVSPRNTALPPFLSIPLSSPILLSTIHTDAEETAGLQWGTMGHVGEIRGLHKK
jgi:hypothetical protein